MKRSKYLYRTVILLIIGMLLVLILSACSDRGTLDVKVNKADWRIEEVLKKSGNTDYQIVNIYFKGELHTTVLVTRVHSAVSVTKL